jgi:3-dehydroquinate dehydratase/shikimate dehydrogenase
VGAIAIALGRESQAALLAALEQARGQADLVELRLDFRREPFDLPRLLAARPCPAIVTLRPPREGGHSELADAKRIEMLLQAARLGAEYVDLEWDAVTPDAVDTLRAAGARVIVSRHDFSAMPPELASDWYDQLAGSGPDVVKVVGMASDPRDCLAPLRVLRHADLPTIALAMGTSGLPSRILSLREPRCLLTFATLDDGRGTAPGQLTARDLREVYRAASLGPTTRVYGLLSPHVESGLAAQHNQWLGETALDAVAIPVPAADDAPGTGSAYRSLPMAGRHIHGSALQATAGQALDRPGPSACRQGKVNAIVAEGSDLVGYWVETPSEQLELWVAASS